MDWFPDVFDKVLQKKMENDPAFKKKMDQMLDEEKEDRFETIKKQICEELYKEIDFEQKHSNVQNMVNALLRLSNNIQKTPYLDHSESSVKFQGIRVKDPQNGTFLTTSEQVEQSMNRLWDLYKTYCEKLQRLQPEF